MNPMATFVIAALLKYGPGVAREIYKLFTTQDPTLADFEAVFALAEKPYEAYTGASLPPEIQAILDEAAKNALKAAGK